MGRRADHTRGELRQLILDAGTALIDSGGPSALSARAIARRIGYSVGTIYNLFDDLDDLVLQINGRTLDALHARLAAAATGSDPERRVRRLAQAYLDFVATYPRRWACVLEHRVPEGRDRPRWYRDRIRLLFDLAEDALDGHVAGNDAAARRRSAHVLWAGLTGIALLLETASLPADARAADLVASLVDTHLAGMARTSPRPASRARPAGTNRRRKAGRARAKGAGR